MFKNNLLYAGPTRVAANLDNLSVLLENVLVRQLKHSSANRVRAVNVCGQLLSQSVLVL